MQKVAGGRSIAPGYFYWLIFIGTLFIVGDALQKIPAVQFYHAPWLDFLMSYAPVSLSWTAIALAICGLLWRLERLASDRRSHAFGVVSYGFVFFLFIAVFTYVFISPLKASALRLGPWQVIEASLFLAFVGAVFYWRLSRPIHLWLTDTAGRLKPISLAALVIFSCLVAYSYAKQAKLVALAPVAEAAEGVQNRPNVFVIVLDALTVRDMSMYGYGLPTTPNLDRLAQSWTVYENAHSTGTGTLTAMPTLLTGRYPYFDEWFKYGDLTGSGQGWLSLPNNLQSIGYQTMYFQGGGYVPQIYHLDRDFNDIIRQEQILSAGGIFPGASWNSFLGGISMPHDYEPAVFPNPDNSLDIEPMYAFAEQYFTTRTAEKRTQPFFAYLHMNRPHPPYLGGEFQGLFLSKEDGFPDAESQKLYENGKPFSPEWQPPIDSLRLRYDENVRKADAEVNHFIETLQQLGLYDQSLIIITADHGTNFSSGYYGYYTPLLSAAEHSIPLLVKLPGQTQGRRTADLISNVDIMPTILDVTGIPYSGSSIDGRSLLQTEGNNNRTIYVRLPNAHDPSELHTVAALQGNLKLVDKDGNFFLWGRNNDLYEQNNLYGTFDTTSLENTLMRFEERMEYLRSGGPISNAPEIAN